MTIQNLMPYLCVSAANAAIEFYTAAFGASEDFRLSEPSGRLGHAELDFGGMTLMLSDEYPEMGVKSASTLGATPVTLYLQVDDADSVVKRALSLGATLESEVVDHFYGERSGTIHDPFGHRWVIGQSIEEVEPEEMQRRFAAMMSGGE